jgi:hypothetical protein
MLKGKKLLKAWRRLPPDIQTGLVFGLFNRELDSRRRYYDENGAYQEIVDRGFDDLELDDASTCLKRSEREYAVRHTDSLEPFYREMAEYIYCLDISSRSAEAIQWDAGRKMRNPVLREVVMTLMGLNDSRGQMLENIAQMRVSAKEFFHDYYSADMEQDRIKVIGQINRERERFPTMSVPTYSPWKTGFLRVGYAVLGFLVAVNAILVITMCVNEDSSTPRLYSEEHPERPYDMLQNYRMRVPMTLPVAKGRLEMELREPVEMSPDPESVGFTVVNTGIHRASENNETVP